MDVSLTEKAIRNRNIRLYVLTDDAGNATEFQLEIHQTTHQIKAGTIGIKYNGESVPMPKNSFKIEYVIKNGRIKMLNQFLTVEDTRIHLIYCELCDQTNFIINGVQERIEGLSLLAFSTNRGDLRYKILKMRQIP